MRRADLEISRSIVGEVRLRTDMIRHTTLVELGRAWLEDPTAVADVLDALAETLRGARREGEVDAAVEDVESVCHMGPAEMPVGRPDLVQLINEALTAYGPRPAAVAVARLVSGSEAA